MSTSENFIDEQSWFKDAFDTASIGMALVSPEGKWLKVNNSLLNIVGYSEDELLQKSFQDITHPEDLSTDLGYVKQMLAGEIQNYSMTKRYFHKDGHIVWIRLSVSLVRNNDGSPKFFVSQIENISDKVHAEERLESEVTEGKKMIHAMTGRELKMIDLKKEVDDLLQQLGKPPKYYQ